MSDEDYADDAYADDFEYVECAECGHEFAPEWMVGMLCVNCDELQAVDEAIRKEQTNG